MIPLGRKKFWVTLGILMVLHARHPGAQNEEIATEDNEVIENLDILESLEFLEEELPLLENYQDIGEEENE